MGMSTYIHGYRNLEDPKHLKMVAAVNALLDVGGDPDSVPEIVEYFKSSDDGWYHTDGAIEVQIPKTEWGNDYSNGYEIRVKDIPEGVEVIRFYNSY